jgi:hypothetical protein
LLIIPNENNLSIKEQLELNYSLYNNDFDNISKKLSLEFDSPNSEKNTMEFFHNKSKTRVRSVSDLYSCMQRKYSKELLEYYNILQETKKEIFWNNLLDYIWHNKIISKYEYGVLTGGVSMIMKEPMDLLSCYCPLCGKCN